MPPKVRYSRESILDAAYELVRSEGEEALSARTLAARLGCSTAPIFTAFPNIEAIHSAVAERAMELYDEYITAGVSQTPAFKGAGMQYIRFAKDEPKLFRMLFMHPDSRESHCFPSGDGNEGRVRGKLEEAHTVVSEDARRLYDHLSVYAHGLATINASGNCTFSDEDVSRMMSEAFMAFEQYNVREDI